MGSLILPLHTQHVTTDSMEFLDFLSGITGRGPGRGQGQWDFQERF